MIKHNYKITRDEKDQIKSYTPSLPNELEDLICIEGPNSSGKSTLLNILALGLYGTKDKRIKESLQQKLRDLMESSHQQLEFSFEISSEKNNLTLVAEKADGKMPQVNLVEICNGKKRSLSAESFQKSYRLIYDVPDNPLGRLTELAHELKDAQSCVGARASRLVLSIRDVLEEVKQSKNPERIRTLKKEISKFDSDVHNLKIEKEIAEEELDLVGKFYHCSCFSDNATDYKRIRQEIDDLNERSRQKEKKKKKLDKNITQFVNDLETHKSSMREIFNEVILRLRKADVRAKDNYLGLWKDRTLEDLLQGERSLIFFQGVTAYRDEVAKLVRETDDTEKMNEADLLQALVSVLEHYVSTRIVVPGVNKSVRDFIDLLNAECRKFEGIRKEHSFYSELLKKLDDLKAVAQRYVNYFLPKIAEYNAELTSGKTADPGDSEGRLAELERQSDKHKNACEYHKEQFIKLGIKEAEVSEELKSLRRETYVKPYLLYKEKDLEAAIKSLRGKLDQIRKSIKEAEYHLQRFGAELDGLEKKKPHKYETRRKELETLFGAIQRLEQRLVREWDSNIRSLIQRKIDAKSLTKTQRLYFDSVATYLAKKVETIRHVDKKYTVSKVDLVDGEVRTQSGKRILLTDFGTGQSQSAYLQGLLKTTGNQKIIALIDEVAMMDESSMRPIYDLLLKQYEKGQLLAGIVVQRGEKLKVTRIC